MEQNGNSHEQNNLPWSLDSGTLRMRYGLDLAKLALGQLPPERTEKVLELANGYINTVTHKDPETGEQIDRHDLTADGMKVIEQYAWPVLVQEIKDQTAERTNTHTEQKTLF